MKAFIIFACLLAIAFANENANVLQHESVVNVDSFKYVWELDNSAKVQQEGHLNGESWDVQGSQAWTSPEGDSVSLIYKADENGYQVLEANPPLPTPPPIPEAILKSLDFIAAHGNSLKNK